MGILEALQKDDYRIGDCQAIVYDRKRTNVFPPGFLSRLYFSFLGDRYSNRPSGTGILNVGFCGMSDVSHDAVVDYWLHHPLAVLGIWTGDVFDPCGVAYPSMMIGAGEEERACYGGYLFQRRWWGSEEQEVLATLGLAILFQEMKLSAIHGSRYEDNDLTEKFMRRFGFRDLCTLPQQMTRGGKLVSAVISTLSRADFEKYCERQVLETYRHLWA